MTGPQEVWTRADGSVIAGYAPPRWTLDHGVLSLDGEPLLTLVRARWGDGAPPESRLDALSARIVALLNAEGVEA